MSSLDSTPATYKDLLEFVRSLETKREADHRAMDEKLNLIIKTQSDLNATCAVQNAQIDTLETAVGEFKQRVGEVERRSWFMSGVAAALSAFGVKVLPKLWS